MHPIGLPQRLVAIGTRNVTLPYPQGLEKESPLASIVGEQRHGGCARANFDVAAVKSGLLDGTEHDIGFCIRPQRAEIAGI